MAKHPNKKPSDSEIDHLFQDLNSQNFSDEHVLQDWSQFQSTYGTVQSKPFWKTWKAWATLGGVVSAAAIAVVLFLNSNSSKQMYDLESIPKVESVQKKSIKNRGEVSPEAPLNQTLKQSVPVNLDKVERNFAKNNSSEIPIDFNTETLEDFSKNSLAARNNEDDFPIIKLNPKVITPDFNELPTNGKSLKREIGIVSTVTCGYYPIKKTTPWINLQLLNLNNPYKFSITSEDIGNFNFQSNVHAQELTFGLGIEKNVFSDMYSSFSAGVGAGMSLESNWFDHTISKAIQQQFERDSLILDFRGYEIVFDSVAIHDSSIASNSGDFAYVGYEAVAQYDTTLVQIQDTSIQTVNIDNIQLSKLKLNLQFQFWYQYSPKPYSNLKYNVGVLPSIQFYEQYTLGYDNDGVKYEQQKNSSQLKFHYLLAAGVDFYIGKYNRNSLKTSVLFQPNTKHLGLGFQFTF